MRPEDTKGPGVVWAYGQLQSWTSPLLKGLHAMLPFPCHLLPCSPLSSVALPRGRPQQTRPLHNAPFTASLTSQGDKVLHIPRTKRRR